jgi:hypothetical protein
MRGRGPKISRFTKAVHAAEEILAELDPNRVNPCGFVGKG